MLEEKILLAEIQGTCAALFETIWRCKKALRGKPSATVIAGLVLFAKQCHDSQLRQEQEMSTAVRVGLASYPKPLSPSHRSGNGLNHGCDPPMAEPLPLNESTGARAAREKLFDIIWSSKESLREKPSATAIAGLVLFARQCEDSQLRQEQEMSTAVRVGLAKRSRFALPASHQPGHRSNDGRYPKISEPSQLTDLSSQIHKRNAALLRELEADILAPVVPPPLAGRRRFMTLSFRYLDRRIVFLFLTTFGTGLGLLTHLICLHFFPETMSGETILEVLFDLVGTMGAFAILCVLLLKLCEFFEKGFES